MAHGTHHALLALDIENNTKTGAFICAGLFGKIESRAGHNHDKAEHEIKEYFTGLDDLHDYLLALKKGSCRLVFYNLSYDIVYLRDILAPPSLDRYGNVKNSLLQVGTRVITATLKNGIKCIDLFNHTCGGSLDDWARYCGFKEKSGLVKPDLSDLFKRVMVDAEITYRLGAFLEDFYYHECGIPLQLTVGASALKIYLAKYFKDYWRRDDETLNNFERAAYYGGRTEIFKRGDYHNYSYDINSTYVSIMRDCLIPDITTARRRSSGRLWRLELGKRLNKYLAIIECRVRAPSGVKIGVLPVRVGGKLTFPLGEFRGTWCNIEIAAALDQGYEVLEVYQYVFYRQAKPYFRDFANFIWQKRIEYRQAGNAGMDTMIKRVGNALYGKFGERHQAQTEIKLSEIDFILPDGSEIFQYLGTDWVRLKGERTPSQHEFPCVPAFITAYARLKLLQGMLANAKNIIYVDTDSMKLTAPATGINTGENLGDWKFEGDNQAIFYRCKFYGDKHKGVPKNAKIVKKTRQYIKYAFVKPTREREAMRRNLVPNVWLDQFKTLLFNDDKRIWHRHESQPNILFYDTGENKILTSHKK